jgi:EmrB/QacA subfamily drug resistance transporter
MSAGPGRADRATLVLVAMTLANAMILVDQTAVPLALPDIIKEFGISSNSSQWVMTASLLPLAGLLVLGGRLGDALGRRRIFLLGALMFGCASAVGGLAPSFDLLIVARVVQGAGGALMLPGTVAILSASVEPEKRGRALGLMGGTAAVAGALGPTIGGLLTSIISWRAVLLVCVPLLVVTVVLTLRSVPADAPSDTRVSDIDLLGAALLCATLGGLVFGLSQTQNSSFHSIVVLGPVVAGVIAGALFVWRERAAPEPLMSFSLLRTHPNYLAASLSQGLAGMAEMGLGIIFPLILILNLGMTPAEAGFAMIPTTVPMVILAPMVGSWYDRVGGRAPMTTGFVSLGLASVLLAIGVNQTSYVALLPGFLLYGVGLAIVLTVNDPVTLDTLPEPRHGEAAGVSATAEQGGGALGIAILYSIFHTVYVQQLHEGVNSSPLKDLTNSGYERLRAGLIAAENTGLVASNFDPALRRYLYIALKAAEHGYTVAFVAVGLLAVIGAIVAHRLVVRPPGVLDARPPEPIPEVPLT